MASDCLRIITRQRIEMMSSSHMPSREDTLRGIETFGTLSAIQQRGAGQAELPVADTAPRNFAQLSMQRTVCSVMERRIRRAPPQSQGFVEEEELWEN